jgi:hypothetical protein
MEIKRLIIVKFQFWILKRLGFSPRRLMFFSYIVAELTVQISRR